MDYGEPFSRLCGIVERLRGEGGCPWDREQSPQSLRGDLIEETYECIEAIDEKDPSHIREELGDIFLLVTMISYMHQEAGAFSIPQVLEGIAEKLVRRHPHVFGKKGEGPGPGKTGPGLSSAAVLNNWARIKVEEEGRPPRDSILDEVSRSLPPLDRAWKLQKKAAKAGFDWPGVDGALDKIREELGEVERAIRDVHPDNSGETPAFPLETTERPAAEAPAEEHLEEELGDLLFSAVNLCRFLRVEPSTALQRTNAKFTRRFRYVEQKIKESGRSMTAENLAIMDRYWNEAKAAETQCGMDRRAAAEEAP